MRRLSPAEFVTVHTRVRPAPYVPEVRLRLGDDSLEIWEATQVAVDRGDLPPPFWAFAWAGGQALARHLLDSPAVVAGRPVVDVATGSGLVAIAAVIAGATDVTAYDIDEFAVAAVRLNARLNHVRVTARLSDVGDITIGRHTLVTVGDVFYDEGVAAVMLPSLTRLAREGAEVLIGDPHRSHFPLDRVQPVATYDVEVDPDLENAPIKRTVVARLVPG